MPAAAIPFEELIARVSELLTRRPDLAGIGVTTVVGLVISNA